MGVVALPRTLEDIQARPLKQEIGDMTPAIFIMNLYRALVPISVRRSDLIVTLKSHLKRDWIYNSDYYATTVEGPAAASAERIADSIISDFKPTSIVDVGCGTGALLAALRHKGIDVSGLEYSEQGLKYCRARRLSVTKFDIERDVFDSDGTFSVAVSLEVAEHLPEIAADRYVDLLVRLAPVVVFSAAPPGQGGTDHVNLQPPSYWIAKFRQHGLEYADELSRYWRAQWKAAGDVETWYYQNLMIFQSCAISLAQHSYKESIGCYVHKWLDMLIDCAVHSELVGHSFAPFLEKIKPRIFSLRSVG